MIVTPSWFADRFQTESGEAFCMMNDRRRWLGILVFLSTFPWILSWSDPVGWSQETAAPTEEQTSTLEEQTPTSNEVLPEEAESPSQEVLSPPEESPPISSGELAVPAPEGPSSPEKYTVKKGDTLWDISNSHMRDSFLWPKLWKHNQYIMNPDLIYPGNVIELPGEEGAQQAALVETERLTPTEPPQAVEEPTPMEADRAVEAEVQEQTAPQVKPLDQALLATSGYILTGQKAVGVVVGARDNRELIGQDETAYLLPKNGTQLRVGDQYTLYRVMRKVYHPKTGKYIGDLIRILGVAEVTGADPQEKTVTAHVRVSYDTIRKGDSLMPAQTQEESVEETSPSAPSNNALQGFIVEVKEDRVSQAQSDVVYLDRGRQDGLRSGDRFTVVREGDKTSIFSPGKGVRLPQRIVGELQVIAVQDVTATAKVIKSTEVIFKGDRFETNSGP
jgi:LysM repeat protein